MIKRGEFFFIATDEPRRPRPSYRRRQRRHGLMKKILRRLETLMERGAVNWMKVLGRKLKPKIPIPIVLQVLIQRKKIN